MTRAIAIAMCALTACALDAGDDEGESQVAISMPAAQAQRVLDLVNYPGTDLATLDTTVALDAVSYVGDSALTKLAAYADAHPAPAAQVVEGVVFQGWEAEAVVWGVNRASVGELDVDAKLDARAATNLVAKAPFATVAAMGPVAQVGTQALTALRARASVWWQRMHATTPPACDLAFTVIDDATADDLNELLEAATSSDYPAAAEIVTLQIPPCALTDATQRARIAPSLPYLGNDVIHWAIDVTVQRPTAGELSTGAPSYVSDVREIATLISDRGWQPSTPREQDLFARMPQLIGALTDAPAASPNGYVQSLMRTDADECSESAAVMINASNGRVSLIHFFPRC
ncbi:MAG TPA: hypothetical protein VL463_02935 [Kofleriaceae bacterium]|nr:hypothetical protein [Kofleriaceae bacterium]